MINLNYKLKIVVYMKSNQVYIRLADGTGYEMDYDEPKSINNFL